MPKYLTDQDARTLSELVTWYRRNRGRLVSQKTVARPMVFPVTGDAGASSSVSEPSVSEPSVSEPSVSSESSVSEPSVSSESSVSESSICNLIPGVSFDSLPVVSAGQVEYLLAVDGGCLVLVEVAACDPAASESAGGGGGSESDDGGAGGGGPGGGLP